MSDLISTFLVTFGIMGLALLGILIGWIFTGKPFTRGSCGRNLQQGPEKECGQDDSCPICSPYSPKSNKRDEKTKVDEEKDENE